MITSLLPSAYVVHAHPEQVKTPEAKAAFGASVAKWMETRVAKHKFLRGGSCLISSSSRVLSLTM
jgi:4-coumarate--CoA ligase